MTGVKFAKILLGAAPLALAGCVVTPVDYKPTVASDYAPVPVNSYNAPRMRYIPADYRGGVAPTAAYQWIDEADGFAQAIGDAPPDFTFRFDGRDAWAWVSQAGEAMIVEQGIYGVIQYYYAPNAAAPYLVRDVYDSYGFDGPDLTVIYDSQGQVNVRLPTQRTLDTAEEFQRRGRAIRSAALDRRWDRDSASRWSSQTFVGFSFGSDYDRGWSGGWQPRWRDRRDWSDFAWRQRERDLRRRLDDEHRARHDHGRRFRDWQRRGGRDAPPAMAPVPPDAAAGPPPAGAPRPGRPPRTDMTPPVGQPTGAPAAAPDAQPRPPRPPRNMVDPVSPRPVRPLPEVTVGDRGAPDVSRTPVESLDAENPAMSAPPVSARPDRAPRRPSMTASVPPGTASAPAAPEAAAPIVIDQEAINALELRRQMQLEDRRQREAAARAEQEQRDSAMRAEMMARQAEAERAEAAARMAADNAAAAAAAEAANAAREAEARAAARAEQAAAAAAARAEAAAAAAAAAERQAAERAAQPRVRSNNVDESNEQPQ